MTELIDREAVIEIITEKCLDCNAVDCSKCKVAAMQMKIESLDTVDAEPVQHGYWIPVDGGDSCDEWECSACGRVMTFTHEADYDDMREDFPRCPKCGAYMDVEEGEDETNG